MSKFTQLAKRHIVPTTAQAHDGLRLLFDIETDGLLDKVTRVHCAVVVDLDSGQVDEYGPAQIADALEHLARASYLTGHNILNYDLRVLQKLHGWSPAAGCKVLDTLIASRLILPHLSDLDDKAAATGDPKLGMLRGRYSIEAWGARLGIPKVGIDIKDWSAWTPEIQARCVADVAINKALWEFLQPDGYSARAMELEHRAAAICSQITADGVPFDAAAAARLHRVWKWKRAKIAAQLALQFPGTNFNSRKQIGEILEAKGWKPAKRTEKTKQAVIDDETLEALPTLYPELAGLSDHFTLGRRLGQLANGEEAWSGHVGADGRIHGGLVHIGTPHSRAKHMHPNLAQVPNQKKGKPFAVECRGLFRAPPGWVFVAADQAGLQDRGLAHYLAAHDEGAYARTFLDGTDTHWKSATALGLTTESRDKQSALHTSLREGAKRFRYAFLYGCGAEKAGRIVNDTVRIAQQIDPGNGLQQKFFAGVAHPKAPALKRVGKTAITRFEAGTLGLKQLREKLGKHAGKFSWLPGLDGRRVPVRAQHTALNFIVTSSEAIICKRWLALVHDELRQRFRYGWDGDVVLVLWIHDELVCCCRPEIAAEVGEIMFRLAVEPGEFYGFKAPLAAEYKIGPSWAGEIPAEETLPEGAEELLEEAAQKPKKPPQTRERKPEPPVAQPTAPGAARAPQVAESPNTATTGIDRERAAAIALMRWRKGLPPSPSGNGAASDKPKTHNADLTKLPPALEHFACEPIWVNWRWIKNSKGKWTKEPYRTDDPELHASSSDPRTWGTYSAALKQVTAGSVDGLGIAVRGCNIGGVDLDHCIDAAGVIAPWAQAYLDRMPTAYHERTVSGTGLRILGTADYQELSPKFKLPELGNGAAVELFAGSNFYLTVSGNEIGSCAALPPIGAEMKAIAAELSKRPPPDDGHDAAADSKPTSEEPTEQLPQNAENELRMRSALEAIPTDEAILTKELENSHMVWVNIGRALERLDWDETGYIIWRNWSARNSENFDEKGLRKNWASFRKNCDNGERRVTYLTIFRYARHFGWIDPQEDAAVDVSYEPRATITEPAGSNGSGDSAPPIPAPPPPKPKPKRAWDGARVSTFKRKSITWLWQGRFAIGKLGIIAGLPDEGKGNLLCYITSRITRGGSWPCNEGQVPLQMQGNVLLLTAEDEIEDTVRPRLEAAGADIDRVIVLQMVRSAGQQDRMFSLITDLDLLREKILEIGNVRLVLIDPISAYLGVGKMDTFRQTDVRAVLSPLVDLAHEMQIAIIGIMHFNKKTDVDSVLLRISDSQAFGAQARHAYAVIDDAENDRKLFVKGKNNNAPKEQKALAFTFSTKKMEDEDTGELFDAPYIVWQDEYVDITASEAMRAVAGSNKKPAARSDAKEFLESMLANGAVDADEIKEAAEANGISERTLWRAKKELKVIATKRKGTITGGWAWQLPDQDDFSI